MKTSSRIDRRLGWLLPALAVVMGTALVTTTWSSYAHVMEATSLVVRGQGVGLIHEIRGALRTRAYPPTQADLAEVLRLERDAGLTYLALVDPTTGTVTSAGKSTLGLDRVRTETKAGHHARFLAAKDHRTFIGDLVLPPPRPAAGETAPTEKDRERWLRIALEFRPSAAHELRVTATRTLLIGAAATLIFLLTAVAFVKVLRQRDAILRDLARDRRLAALGEMSAVLAHEIRNPLASLKGHAQLLAEALPEEGAEHAKAERVVAEAIRLEALASDLLAFVRSGDINRARTDPAALLRACVSGLADAGRVAVVDEGAPSHFSLDADRMRQVLSNLLENAVAATPAGKAITATVTTDDGRLVFTVADGGEGLPAGDTDRLFEPFFTRRVRGTGLGLAIAKRIVELHGGTITAMNAPEGGAVFRVSLPEGGS